LVSFELPLASGGGLIRALDVFHMSKDDVVHNWSDAWLLLAIIYASNCGEATLEKIIAAGDAIDVAIFTPDELESGFARLTDGGYVEEKSGIFCPTAKARAHSKSAVTRRAMHKELKDVEEMLGAPSAVSEQPLPNNLKYPGFSAAVYDEAVERYRQRV